MMGVEKITANADSIGIRCQTRYRQPPSIMMAAIPGLSLGTINACKDGAGRGADSQRTSVSKPGMVTSILDSLWSALWLGS